MGKIAMMTVLGVTLLATACARAEDEEALPADTATMAPAPAPMQMDSAAHDTMQSTTTQ